MRCLNCTLEMDRFPAACPQCGQTMVIADRYVIRSLLGRGGMGEVYLAYDLRLETEVAIKRIPTHLANDADLRAVLLKEARIMARLTDNAIVRMFDLAETPDGMFLILEYVCGPSLQDMLAGGYQPDSADALHILRDVCAGLEVAHGAGVIHRDLKPGNFLIELQGEERQQYREHRRRPANLRNARIKITDFGIAKALSADTTHSTQHVSGTPSYMSPEQLRGEAPSPETDVYAVGVIAYQLIAGRLPFMTEHPAYYHLCVAPEPIPNCGPGINAVVLKALSKPRADRYPSASAFFEAFSAAAAGAPVDAGSTKAYPPPPPRVVPLTTGVAPAAKILLAIAGVMILGMGLWVGLRNIGKDGLGIRRTDSNRNMPTVQEEEAGFEPKGVPYVEEAPPPVAGAAPKVAGKPPKGPQKPTILWRLASNVGGIDVLTAGSDGTVYGKSSSAIWGIRDGKLAWGYKLHPSPGPIEFDAQGRLWFTCSENSGTYCINSNGQGGRLPVGTKRQFKERISGVCYTDGTFAAGKARIKLDNECATHAVGSDGVAYIATQAPSITAVRQDSSVIWKATPGCIPASLAPVPVLEDVLFGCENHTLNYVHAGAVRWTNKTHGSTFGQRMTADSEGTVYYLDSPDAGNVGHVHAVNAEGRMLWTLNMDDFNGQQVFLGDDGRLYINGFAMTNSSRTRLLCLGDSR